MATSKTWNEGDPVARHSDTGEPTVQASPDDPSAYLEGYLPVRDTNGRVIGARPVYNKDVGGASSMGGAILDDNSAMGRAYQWLGEPGAAERESRWASGWADLALRGGAPQFQAYQLNAANPVMQNEMAARRQQADVTGQFASAAKGYGPSLAGLQMRAGLDSASDAAARASIAPPSGAVAAGRRSVLGLGAAGANVAMNAAGTRAEEIGAARGSLAGLAGTMRTSDQDVAIRNAQLRQNQQNLNDAYYNMFKDMSQNIRKEAQRGGMARGEALGAIHRIGTASAAGRSALAAQKEEADTRMALGLGGAVVGGTAGMLAGGPAGAAVGASTGYGIGRGGGR